MKIIKLNEKAADVQNKEMKLYGGEKGKPESPYEAYRSAKGVKEMDDSVAWALNIATGEKGYPSPIGDTLQSNLPQGTLSEFIDAFKWEEIGNEEDLPVDNLFIYLLKRLNSTGKLGELNNLDDFRLVYNGYVNDIYSKEDIDNLSSTSNKNKSSWLSQLLDRCKGNKNTNKPKKQSTKKITDNGIRAIKDSGDKEKANWAEENRDNLEAFVDAINNQ